ncbi:MAG: PIN domain-containing protein [Flavobacteriia bacterium]|nr:PIN domain-containing protein [Flavobacteriia bacterium]OIP48144.1 MAG: DNA-binding protein [Flavobacteriaceae bacterium CG2_30_31_66]PIV97850.1 MAG: DNA-binding protein [Flavobacteriaceae bacterium CG17_big_fil_post_rev_8_21_14_2_50_31_13]PIX13662.1 MAG: DNA-binding protein [Flavobacteriaceae bacterium CG_4_8_14_3_um_filter_31_8]PIY14591.1 MAG: DNA-binding protein [Flavobacteriaceae bacterium CG_4_10_14_3_um_filter_31_253]PIZ10858.1 MAG: DNA-binding protein [Flavobacteriaceae bacterium CG_
MKNVLIDTDVILDFFLDREPFSENAANILALCEKKGIIGYVTPVIVSNVYYLLSQKAKQEKVIEKLKLLLSILEILVIDKNAIVVALNSDFKDFEDALQNYAAELSGEINLIITRNTKDYKKSNLGVMSPEDFLKLNFLN